MRRFWLVAPLYLFAAVASAQSYGRMDFSLQNAQGQAISGATVTVYTQSACGAATAGTLATLYPTASGGTPLTNPVRTDGFGHAAAYTASGCYTVVYYSQYTGTQTYPDQVPTTGGGGGGGGGGTWNSITHGQQTGSGTSQLNTLPGTLQSLSLVSSINPVYDVAAYGTPQVAIDAAHTAGGGTVQFHANTTYTGALTLSANVTLQCVDRTSILTIPNATNAAVITVAGSNAAIKHCTIDGNGSNQSATADGIKNSVDYSNLAIEDNEIRNIQRYGIRSDAGLTGIHHVTIKGNYIHDVNGQILYLLGMEDLSISGNLFANWTLGGAGDAPAITLADGDVSSPTYHITNLVIAANTFKNSIGTRFAIESAAPAYSTVTNGCSITGNVFDGNNLDASGVSGWFFNCSITGNENQNGGGSHRSGYEVVGTNLVISNNSINNGTIVITSNTNSSSQISATGNVITNSSANGVGDASCVMIGGGDVATTDVLVEGNVCSLTNADPQSGIYLGVYGTSQTINHIKVQNNQILCAGTGNAVRLFAGAGSTDIEVSGNTGTNCTYGYVDSSDANHTTGITLTGNDFSSDTTPISITDTTSVLVNGNKTSASQTAQQLAGGAGSTGAGQGFFPSGVANGNLETPPTANLTGWYSASSVCSVDGTSLTSWAPAATGFGGTLAGGTTKGICKTGIVNGQAVLRFSGSTNGYAGLLQSVSNPTTIFVVYNRTAGTPSSGSSFLIDHSQFSTYGAMYFPNTTTLRIFAAAALSAAVSDDGLWHTALSTITTGGVGTIYLDGAQLATGSVAASPSFPGITIGSRQDQSNFFTGDIAEVLVYNGILSTSQMQSVGVYLSNKYGVAYSGSWNISGGAGTFSSGVKIGTGATITGNQGNGANVLHATGAFTSGNIVKTDASGNAVDGGASTAGVSDLAASSPIVVSGATGSITVSCPTCSIASGGTNVSVNGGGTLAGANINATTPAAAAGYVNATPQISAADVSLEVPNTMVLNGVTATLGGSATVPAAAGTLTGSALAAGVMTSSLVSAAGGTFDTGAFNPLYTLPISTTSVLGGVKPDGTTITITGGGVITAAAGSSIINSGSQWSPAYYATAGTVLSGTTPFSGLQYWPGSAAPRAATAANVVGVIGSTPVQIAAVGNNIAGGALGSIPYQNLAATTLFMASPTLSGHTFVPAWQPSGAAIAPAPLDLATWFAAQTVASSQLPNATNAVKGGVICGAGTACSAGTITVAANVASINGSTNAAQTIVNTDGAINVATVGGVTTLGYTGPGTGTGTNPTIKYPPTAYATLVGTYPCNSGNKGLVAEISDSTVNTWGTAITVGGGSNEVLAHCNGANWTVMGI